MTVGQAQVEERDAMVRSFQEMRDTLSACVNGTISYPVSEYNQLMPPAAHLYDVESLCDYAAGQYEDRERRLYLLEHNSISAITRFLWSSLEMYHREPMSRYQSPRMQLGVC